MGVYGDNLPSRRYYFRFARHSVIVMLKSGESQLAESPRPKRLARVIHYAASDDLPCLLEGSNGAERVLPVLWLGPEPQSNSYRLAARIAEPAIVRRHLSSEKEVPRF